MKILLGAVISFLGIISVCAQTEPRAPAPANVSRLPSPEAGSSGPQKQPTAPTPPSSGTGPATTANDPFQESRSFIETEFVKKGRPLSTLDHLWINLHEKKRSFEGWYFFGFDAKGCRDWRRLSESEKGFLRAILPNWSRGSQPSSARPGDLLIDLQDGPADGSSEPKGFVLILRELLPGSREAKGMAYGEKGYKLPGNEVLTESKWLSFEEKPMELYQAEKGEWPDWPSPFHLLQPIANASGSVAAIVAQDEHYLDYAIPADAKKIGPKKNFSFQDMISYFLPETDLNYSPVDPKFLQKSQAEREGLVGRECFNRKGALIRRELWKDGSQHGVQREWYPNGQLKSEEPYRYGTMQGVFKYWDEQGQLIGQSVLNHGAGTVSIYDSSGRLTRERRYVDSQEDGLQVERFTEDGEFYFDWLTRLGTQYADGRPNNEARPTRSFRVSADGTLVNLISLLDKGTERKGLSIDFLPDGSVQKIVWYVGGRECSEAEYAAAAKSDPALPPYYADHARYRELVGPDEQALAEKYLKMPKVKIPLEFDPAGNPVLAH